MKPNSHILEMIGPDLRCPACRGLLAPESSGYQCRNTPCQRKYPCVEGIPVLIDEQTSVFSLADFVYKRDTFFQDSQSSRPKKSLYRLLPSLTINLKAAANYARFAETLLTDHVSPRVLVLGGSILGQGMETLLHYPQITLVETDVAFGPRTLMIADAHRIPLADESVDGVVVQAVLEHVMDPYQCVREIWRVLKPKGLVYAETPFMQQVHGWPYDFTRFTHLGHRRLFMQFEEMSSGVVNGPGVALAEAYQYFLMCFFKSSFLKKAAQIFARFTAFFLKYFDYFLIRRPGALAAASGYYFFGRKSWRTLSDRELLSFYNEGGEVGRK